MGGMRRLAGSPVTGSSCWDRLDFDKFSSELQMGIILKAGTCYPTFDQIYDMSNEVINVINKTWKKGYNLSCPAMMARFNLWPYHVWAII